MHNSPSTNFAARLLERLGDGSSLVDAATGQSIAAADLAAHIVGFAARFSSAGLQPGDRVLIICGVNPASALAYLGAMYAGVIPVLLDERTHAASGDQL